jgi:hypothetical protein
LHPTDIAISVDYATSDGTASAGSDYTAASGMLTFVPGQTSQSFSVGIVDDELTQGKLTVNLVLANPTNATLGNLVSAILIIREDDLLPIHLPVMLNSN